MVKGKAMRKSGKFFSFIFLLLLAGGAGFILGYTPFKVPHDSIGIIVSKTSGVNERPVERGVFRWDWQFLIPTNAKINSFSSKPFSYSKFITGKLPSADIYSNQLEQKPDFSYSFNFDIQFKCSPNELVKYVKESSVSNDAELQKLLKVKGDQISDYCENLITQNTGSNSFNVEQIKNDIIKKYSNSELEILSVSISNVTVPDFELYKKCRDMYETYLTMVNAKLLALADSQAKDIADYAKNLNRLEQFGKVLKEHPELAEFLKSSNDLNETLKTINSFR